MRSLLIAAIISSTVTGAARPGSAQEPREEQSSEPRETEARSFVALRDHLRVGDTVFVQDSDRNELKGKIEAFDWENETLTLRDVTQSNRDVRYRRERWARTDDRTLDATELRRLELQASDSLANGAIIGAAIGGGLVLLAGVNCECDSGDLLLAGIFWTAIGGSLGVGFDALSKERIVLYESADDGSVRWKIGAAPFLSRGARGVTLGVSLQF